MSIAIPSYNRIDTLGSKTLATLERFNVAKQSIHIFVVEEDYDSYFCRYGDKYKIIKGVHGLKEQRHFIESYFKEGERIVFIDDDITDFDFGGKTFDGFITEAFNTCLNNKAYIFSLYPVWNKFYREKQQYITTDLRFCIGSFYGIINRHSSDLQLTIPNSMKGDVERTLLHWIKNGIVIRFNQYGFKSKMYGIGGCGGFKERLQLNEESAKYLLDKYPNYGKIKIRKNGMHEFILNKLPSTKGSFASTPLVKQFSIDKSIFEKLESLLEKYKIPWKSAAGVDSKGRTTNGRRGFDKHRGCIYGYTKHKITRNIDLSHQTKKHPDVYEELIRVGKLICQRLPSECPFDFTSIQVNNNLVCPKHKDTNNVGESLLVSCGDYEGCNIVVEGTEYNSKYSPVIFDGSKLEHWNTKLISGNKYSLIYFNIDLTPKHNKSKTNLAFIHIGKVGGTTINSFISKIPIEKYTEYHLNNNYKKNENYIIWIRNPISRFVSAFNHSYYGCNTDVKTIKSFDLEHCLIPRWMEQSIGKTYVFSQEYDHLIKSFQSANDLAESLSSENPVRKKRAIELMNREEEHLYKGIGWYLDNVDYDKILFVGKTETMTEDIIHLSTILGVQLDSTLKLRENVYIDKSMKHLSPLAIKNIIKWYESDYKALEKLLINGWITQGVYDSYQTFSVSN